MGLNRGHCWPTTSISLPKTCLDPLSSSPPWVQILANVFLYLCAIVVGIMSYYMADRKHRKAFLEARQSLEVKMNLEEQSQQQVRLFVGGLGDNASPGSRRKACWKGVSPGAAGAPWGLEFSLFFSGGIPLCYLSLVPSATPGCARAHAHCASTGYSLGAALLAAVRGQHAPTSPGLGGPSGRSLSAPQPPPWVLFPLPRGHSPHRLLLRCHL